MEIYLKCKNNTRRRFTITKNKFYFETMDIRKLPKRRSWYLEWKEAKPTKADIVEVIQAFQQIVEEKYVLLEDR